MKLGILGTGLIVHDVLPMLHTLNLEKAYILGTEHSIEKTEKLCAEYHLDGCFFDYEKLLASDIDTVYVALPNTLHYAFAKRALEAGKHVIVEKPAAVTVREWDELADMARKNRLILVEAMSLYDTPAYQSIQENLDKLGRIRLVNFQFCQYSSRYDKFKEGIIAPAFDPKCAGGALMDLNVYNIHALLGLFGAPQSTQYFPNIERGIDTSGILVLHYPDFQAVLTAAKDCQTPVSSTIQGDRGCIRIAMPFNQITAYELLDNKGNGKLYDFREEAHRLSYEFRAFCRMIEERDFAEMERRISLSRAALEILERERPYEGRIPK